jgi:transcriptional regulator with XRE-family HTH domain
MSIRTARKKVGLTQSELAEALGVQQSTVAHWEAGTTLPRASKLMAISKILKCSVKRLLENEESLKE